jgi:retinol-binding protein 3
MSRLRTPLSRHRLLAFVPVLVALFAVPAARSQQVSTPDTPAGRTLAAWLEAFNSGDRARVVAYREAYQATTGMPLDAEMGFRSQTGGFDLLSIQKSEPLHIEYRVKERASTTHAFGTLDVADGTPNPKVTGASLRAVPAGAANVSFDIDAATRDRVIDGAIAKLNESYVFPESAKKMEQALRRNQKRGDYDAITNGDKFALLLTTQLQEISHDKHLRVNFSPAPLPPGPAALSPQQIAESRRNLERINCGFEKVERLEGNVGYVKFNIIASPDLCGATASAAMNFIANCEAVIIDLRENGGGDPAMVTFVASYLFETPTHLNDLWTRRTNTTQQFWTLSVVPGKRIPTAPVFVLTSSRTFSGAEEFTYDLKNQKRAVIVGETTGGGAHPVRAERVDDRFMVGVPFARAINPVSKTNWEGTGVEPDVKVAAADALSTAQKLAVEKIASARADGRAGAN